MNAKELNIEVINIISHVTTVIIEINIKFTNKHDLYSYMVSGCSNLITRRFIEAYYEASDYIALTDKLAEVLNARFGY